MRIVDLWILGLVKIGKGRPGRKLEKLATVDLVENNIFETLILVVVVATHSPCKSSDIIKFHTESLVTISPS